MSCRVRNQTIARRRYFRPQENYKRGPRVNEQIRKSPVRLIDENEEMVGIVPVEEALQKARDAGLDLVEVAADSDPPVCRIRDYGKFKYELSKKEKANKKSSKATEMKEVRLGRSMKIDPHDIEIRLKQARKFLRDGHKVQIVQNFRGREMIHRERGTERMQQIIEDLGDISKVEAPPRQTGRRMTMILAPDKRKIEQIKRREAADRESDQDTPAAPPEHEESTSGGEQTKPQAQSEDRTEERSSETVEARHS